MILDQKRELHVNCLTHSRLHALGESSAPSKTFILFLSLNVNMIYVPIYEVPFESLNVIKNEYNIIYKSVRYVHHYAFSLSVQVQGHIQ